MTDAELPRLKRRWLTKLSRLHRLASKGVAYNAGPWRHRNRS